LACLPPQATAERLAHQVVEVFRQPENYLRFSRQARQVVEAEFSLPVTTDKFLKIYEML
jgi:glycosyltransferase involved in cell wall biosynthesis